MIFEVLEVLGDDLEAFPGMRAAKRALERCLWVSFCRFGEIFEILKVPSGRHLGSKETKKPRKETLKCALEP